MGFWSIILAGQDCLGWDIIKAKKKNHIENERHQNALGEKITERQIFLSYGIIQALVRAKYSFSGLKI